jgi:sensor histidine kinase regulating citrate/malate metabolism
LVEVTSGLRPWQRFHIRLTLLYGVVVFTVLVVMSVMFYRYGTESQIAGLKGRLRDTSVSIAIGITPETIAELHDPRMQGSPQHTALLARLAQVAAADPDISDIYVFRRGIPGRFIIVADHVVRATAQPGKVGEEYIPAPHIHMLEALERPTVETDPYTDAWGTVLSGYAPIRNASGEAIAIVGVDVQMASVSAIKARVRNLALLMFVCAVIALVILARVVAVSVREPLYRIVEASEAITSGRQRVRASLDRKDEFGVVGRHFDTMATGLEERDFIKDTFGTYVSPEVVRRGAKWRSRR